VTAGWPRGLPHPEHPEFEAAVRAWLLDRCPPEWRTAGFRGDTEALAWACAHYVSGVQEATRRAYRETRARFEDPDVVARVQASLEAYGAHLVTTAREITLVRRALERKPT